jgi:hypothetical protein
LEVGPENAAALAVYGATGFESRDDHRLMYLGLAEPTHDV